MRVTNRQDARSGAPDTPTPRRLDAAEMWENLCRADELLDECESLAAVGAARAPEIATPSKEAQRG